MSLFDWSTGGHPAPDDLPRRVSVRYYLLARVSMLRLAEPGPVRREYAVHRALRHRVLHRLGAGLFHSSVDVATRDSLYSVPTRFGHFASALETILVPAQLALFL